MIGQQRFAQVNALLQDRLDAVGTLVVVHRGTAMASVAENTAAAVSAALTSGGDLVEIDVVCSSDGQAFVFHDGYEPDHLGIPHELGSLTAAQIDELRHTRRGSEGRPVRVPRLLDLLADFRGSTLFNIDRSWRWWPQVLESLDTLDMTGQLVLKCHASDVESVEALRAHPVPYPFMPICATVAEAERYLDDPQLNTVGVELVTDDPRSPFLDREVIAALAEAGCCVMANAEVLPEGRPLFAGFDDEASVFGSPEQGWGRLLDLGFTAIQTDWPWLLSAFRDARRTAEVSA